MTGFIQCFTKMGVARSIAAIGVLGLLVGCSGQVYTQPTLELDPNMKAYKGVRAYFPANFIEISWTTAVLEEKTNKVLRTSTSEDPQKKCKPRLQYKQVVRADYDRPYQLFYEPGFLEKYSFKAEFDQGMLKSFGVDSAPDRGETFKNLATAAREAAQAAASASFVDDVPCTHEPMLKFIEKLEKVCPGGQCDFTNYMPPK